MAAGAGPLALLSPMCCGVSRRRRLTLAKGRASWEHGALSLVQEVLVADRAGCCPMKIVWGGLGDYGSRDWGWDLISLSLQVAEWLRGLGLSRYADTFLAEGCLDPQPYTLHPTNYTLHPTPLSLNPKALRRHLHR